jgi:bacteriocin-like protein
MAHIHITDLNPSEGELSTELEELSEEDLQQIVGGGSLTVTYKPDGTIIVKLTW